VEAQPSACHTCAQKRSCSEFKARSSRPAKRPSLQNVMAHDVDELRRQLMDTHHLALWLERLQLCACFAGGETIAAGRLAVRLFIVPMQACAGSAAGGQEVAGKTFGSTRGNVSVAAA